MFSDKREYFIEGIKHTITALAAANIVAIKIEEQRKNLTQCMFDTDCQSGYCWRNVLIMEETRLGKLNCQLI